MSEDSIFKPYVEEKVAKEESSAKLLLREQGFKIASTINDLTSDDRFSKNAASRVLTGLGAYFTGKKANYQNPYEESLASMIDNLVGMKVHMCLQDERIMDAMKKEMTDMMTIAAQKQDTEQKEGNNNDQK